MKIKHRGYYVELSPTGIFTGTWLCNPHKYVDTWKTGKEIICPSTPTRYFEYAGHWPTEAEAQAAYDEWVSLGGLDLKD